MAAHAATTGYISLFMQRCRLSMSLTGEKSPHRLTTIPAILARSRFLAFSACLVPQISEDWASFAQHTSMIHEATCVTCYLRIGTFPVLARTMAATVVGAPILIVGAREPVRTHESASHYHRRDDYQKRARSRGDGLLGHALLQVGNLGVEVPAFVQ